MQNVDNLNELYDDFIVVFNKLFHNHKTLLTLKYIKQLEGFISKKLYKQINQLIKGDYIRRSNTPLQFSNLSIQLTNDISQKHKKSGRYSSHIHQS